MAPPPTLRPNALNKTSSFVFPPDLILHLSTADGHSHQDHHFGGGYTSAYIAFELQQTKKGDLMGLDHMRAAMGIRHRG